MKKLWTILITLVILSLTLGTIACGGGATEPTGGEKSLPTSVSATEAGGGSADQGSSGKTCCWREVGTLAPTMPTGQIDDWGGLIVDAIGSQHMDVSYTQCPLKVDFTNVESGMDYVFQGQIIVNEQTGFIEKQCVQGQDCSGGDILGSFTFKLQLIDHHRGKVVKEGQTSWVGESQELVIGERKLRGIGAGLDQIKELSRTFKPLPQIIHDYEGLPEKATLEPEKDPIPAGEKMTIHLKDIVDYKGNKPQPWQWVVVKAEKGQIVGGREQGDGTHAFEVGSGAIDLVYQAPDKCNKDTENKDTITVYNSCNNDLNATDMIMPEKVIATKSFDIECTGWLLEFTYTEQLLRDYNWKEDYSDFWSRGHGERTYTLTGKAILRPPPEKPTGPEYFDDWSWGPMLLQGISDGAYARLDDNYSSWSDSSFSNSVDHREESWVAHYDGNLSIPIRLCTYGAGVGILPVTGGPYYVIVLHDTVSYLENEQTDLPPIPYAYKANHRSTDPEFPADESIEGTVYSPDYADLFSYWPIAPFYIADCIWDETAPVLSGDYTFIGGKGETGVLDSLFVSSNGWGAFDNIYGYEDEVTCHVTWTLTKLGE